MPSGGVGLDIIEIQDWIALVQLEVYLRPTRHRAGDVEALVAIVEKHARFRDLALVHPVEPRRVIPHRDWNAARAGISARRAPNGPSQTRQPEPMVDPSSGTGDRCTPRILPARGT